MNISSHNIKTYRNSYYFTGVISDRASNGLLSPVLFFSDTSTGNVEDIINLRSYESYSNQNWSGLPTYLLIDENRGVLCSTFYIKTGSVIFMFDITNDFILKKKFEVPGCISEIAFIGNDLIAVLTYQDNSYVDFYGKQHANFEYEINYINLDSLSLYHEEYNGAVFTINGEKYFHEKSDTEFYTLKQFRYDKSHARVLKLPSILNTFTNLDYFESLNDTFYFLGRRDIVTDEVLYEKSSLNNISGEWTKEKVFKSLPDYTFLIVSPQGDKVIDSLKVDFGLVGEKYLHFRPIVNNRNDRVGLYYSVEGRLLMFIPDFTGNTIRVVDMDLRLDKSGNNTVQNVLYTSDGCYILCGRSKQGSTIETFVLKKCV